MKKPKKEAENGAWKLSFIPILKYSIIFCVIIVVVILGSGVFMTAHQIKTNTRSALMSARNQVSQRIEESLTLLRSLASLPEYYNPELDPVEKARKLDRLAPHFGYMMIDFVDADISVYSVDAEPASLASRDYMQRLFSTGQAQVTDSFAAGADGVTLNYTVAVPLIDENGNITGCLFCAIYFDEVIELLDNAVGSYGANTTLIGSVGQVMSTTMQDLSYGDFFLEHIRDSFTLGTTSDALEEQLLGRLPGDYWIWKGIMPYYTMYEGVEHTNWNIVCSISFWDAFCNSLPFLLLMSGLFVVFCVGLVWLIQHYVARQKKVIDMLVLSIKDLEKNIYQEERPDTVDFKEIIRLTSEGLFDGLTGVVTRKVFLSQVEQQLKKIKAGKTVALCFVDMDNLKSVNDTYGHGSGDVALKSVGYILREYEKKYDGVVGRYGGDEFVLLLTDLDSEEELRSVLDELVLRLRSGISSAGKHILTQCSIGVAVWEKNISIEQLIANADEALYFVKQNGKGYYKVYQK